MSCDFKFPSNTHVGAIFVVVSHGTKFQYQWNGTEWDFKSATEELGFHQNNNYTHGCRTSSNSEVVHDHGCGGGGCLCPSHGPGATLFFFDAESDDGNVSRFWEEDTVPENLHLRSVATDGTHLRVWVYLEGNRGTTVAPVLTIDGTVVDIDQGELYPYKGFLDLTVDGSLRTVLATSDAYGRDLLQIVEAIASSEVYEIVIGPYPGTQTELKAGDLISIRVTCSNDSVSCELSGLAFDETQVIPMQADNSAGPDRKYAEGTVTIGVGTGSFPVTAISRNSFGTGSAPLTSTEELILNQEYPEITLEGIIYNSGNQGLGENDTADISVLVENFDDIMYSSAYVTIPDPTVYTLVKTVTYLEGDYINTQNYLVLAIRSSNDARTAKAFIITIANENPEAVITIINTNGNVVTSSETGLNYTVQVLANQDLLSVDNLDIPAGTWLGGFAQEGPRTFSRTLLIKDADQRGSHYFSGLQMTNLAGQTGTVISGGAQYFIQGFSEKIIIFPAYSQIAPIGTNITDINNVNVRYNEAVTNLTLRNTTDFYFDGFTITDENGNYDPVGNYLFLTDSNIVLSNTLGSLSVLLVEVS